MDKQTKQELHKIATKIRMDAVTAVYSASSGHPGGSLSLGEILSILYFKYMKVDPKNPKWEDRDRFVLSKGHCAPALYSALAEKGFFPVEDLKTFRKIDSYLQGHPDMKGVPGVDMSSGSLGQGICAAGGMALAAKIDKKDYHVYAVLGDGEIEEGQVWEAAMSAAHFKLDNLTAILDFNGLQIDGPITEIMSSLPIDDKFAAFGWNVINADAHDLDDLERAFDEALATKGRPSIIIANSVKGKGVSFMENQCSWHGSAPNEEQYKQAMEELTAQLSEEV